MPDAALTGRCRVCCRTYRLRGDGTIRAHNWGWNRCAGAWLKPRVARKLSPAKDEPMTDSNRVIENPLYHLSAAQPLSVAELHNTIAAVLDHAVAPDGAPLSDTKDVVISVGGKVYPLSAVAVAFHGGRLVLELAATDVPPCHWCGRIGNHLMNAPCGSWEYMHRGTETTTP